MTLFWRFCGLGCDVVPAPHLGWDSLRWAIALRPLASKYASSLFAFGLYNASVFAASILFLSTAYSICEGMGRESGIKKTPLSAPWFYGLYFGLIFLGTGILLFLRDPLIMLMYLSQVVNSVLLPLALICIQLSIIDPQLIGNYVNSRWYNITAWIMTWVMFNLPVMLVVTAIFQNLFG